LGLDNRIVSNGAPPSQPLSALTDTPDSSIPPKRYQGSVSPRAIRDFRGALVGRADKGLFVTTGTFTREATREATRDGATPIDLMDGDHLAEKLKELRLGVRTEMVESVDVDAEWFRNL
jgi:restriction system protein